MSTEPAAAQARVEPAVVASPAPPVVVGETTAAVVETPAPTPTTEVTPAPAPVVVKKRYGNGFYFGIGGGTGVPTEAIRNGYDPGMTVAVPIGWDSQTGPFGFRVDLGYTHLDSRKTFRNTGMTTGVAFGRSGIATVAAADPQIWSALLDLKFRVPFDGNFAGPTTGLYVVGGGGVNYFRNYSNSFGLTNPEFTGTATASTASLTRSALNAGGGLSWGVGGTSEVFLESRYVTTFTDGRRASFVPIILGVTLR